MFAALVNGDERIEQTVAKDRFIYVHVASGSVSVNGKGLQAGDGAKLTDENHLVLEQGRKAEVLVFELW